MATWAKIERPIKDGTIVSMQAPQIVSASRSTDIPAFYADWFFDRLQKGYSAWTNPFNGVKSYVSYENTRFIVFWSKNPRPLLQHLDYLKERHIGCYIQYTLNDYEKEKLERNVRPLSERIETFKLLVDKLGKGSVIWRFDPMILTDDISVDDLLEKVLNLGDQLKGYTEKLVFSYADILSYRKVKANLGKNHIPYHEWNEEQMEEFARRLCEMNREQGWNFQLATCGEKIPLEQFGVVHNKCIDDDLMIKYFADDDVLMNHLGVELQTDLFTGETVVSRKKSNKDKGQRQLCGCIASKDIGEYNTCAHLCEYCYANASKEIALQNLRKHHENPLSETITGK